MGTEQYSVGIGLSDGGLGVVGADGSNATGMIGTASAGTVDQVYPMAGTDTDVAATTFGGGDLADQVIKHLLTSGGKTVYGVRGAASTAGAAGAATLLSGTGPTVPTFTGAPNEDADFRVRIISTGSQVAATFQFSFNKGKEWSPTKLAGPAIVLGNGTTMAFPTGTFTAGAIFGATFVGPRNSLSDVAAAADALIESPHRFGMIHVLGPAADAAGVFTLAAALNSKAAAAVAVGKMFDFHLEAPAVDPALLITEAAAFEGQNVVIWGGYADIFDDNDRRVEKVPLGRGGVPRVARQPISISAIQNTTDTDVDPFAGSTKAIWPDDALKTGADGYVDSGKLPGLNDERFSTARTIPGRGGSYISNVFTFSAKTSDYSWYPNKRVANRGREVLFDMMWKLAQRRLPLDAHGQLDPVIATGIQDDANALLERALVDAGHATRVKCVIDRTSITALHVKARAQVNSYNRTGYVDFGLALAL